MLTVFASFISSESRREERVEKHVGIVMHRVQIIYIQKIVGIVFLNKSGQYL